MAEIPWWQRHFDYESAPEFPKAVGKECRHASKRSKGHCAYCDLDATADARLMAVLEGDHIVPKSKARSKEDAENHLNYAMACAACNRVKGRYDPSNRKGPAKNERERDELIKEVKAEIICRVRQRSLHEYPLYLRYWQLTLNKKGDE